MTETLNISDKRIRELEWQVKLLEHDLIHDPLTHLYTRNFFEEQGEKYLQSIERFGYKNLSVIFFDIDFFKKVNDTCGHDVGDKILIKVAETIKSNLRLTDTVARWGGEEVVATLLGADEESARIKADEIREAVAKLAFDEVKDLKITVSAGVSASQPDTNLQELVSRADKALYKAKETGRNKVVKYSELLSR